MQGDLSEIDIRSILQLIELGQRTGELYLESYGTYPSQNFNRGSESPLNGSESIQAWLLFWANGQVIYAGNTSNSLNRLRDHLYRYGKQQSLPDPSRTSAIATLNSLEYGTLWTMLEQHLITPDQGRAILRHMVQETLFDLLSLRQGSFVFQLSSALSPQLMTHKVSELIPGLTQQIQTWHQLHPQLQSPDQCPVLIDPGAFQTSLAPATCLHREDWLDGQTSLRQIARYLDQDLVAVARYLLPALQQGHVTLAPSASQVQLATPRPAWPPRPPRVVCVDDSTVIRETVETILCDQGYAATSISNPLKALGLLFDLQPDLILCDIAMPELDGYTLCAMLRQAPPFRQTPMVMLTGKDGFLDRVRARMVGATDYLTKPFGASELLTLVEKYVGPGEPNQPHPDQLLSDALSTDADFDLPGVRISH
ncbi:MAG TPA: response regulator [Leptolyngbyaceae cyanobacterium M65_K2018_010]|nr:response regulator [Leptolyngbyaceae cyanobacterium M65_K2018_010]